ncbi:MAG: Gmad2 immunoglobulin-like domain-containing protein [Patescibacteria group bacterium]
MDVRKLPFLLIGGAIIVLLVLAVFGAKRAEAPGTEPDGGGITYVNATADDIVVDLPFPGAVVGKEFSVVGKARGPWYFEASFPVVILGENGEILAQVPAQAEGEWMTENFVPFKADLAIPESYIGPATLVVKKDNPSGLPEHDASVSFPITIEY